MSTLWTPSGEHEPRPATGTGAPEPPAPAPAGEAPGPAPTAEELAALRRVREQIRATPASAVVANHAVQLFELALVYLDLGGPPDDGAPRPDFARAGLAIDAMAALVDGLGSRLDEHETTLRDALAQIQVLYAQLADQTGT